MQKRVLFIQTIQDYVKTIYANKILMWQSNFQYVYNYTDHLGNIRLSYTYSDKMGYKILQENHYYPFGLKHQNYTATLRNLSLKQENNNQILVAIPAIEAVYNYKYNGKELQEELGLNSYDYGARNYDAVIGRWLNVDPLADQFPNISPYTFVENNPINLIDPDGREPIKPYVGTVAMFIALLNNSPRKVGRYTGTQASNYLKNLGNTEFSWKQMRPLPTQTGYFNRKKGRYIYTKKGGWVDMTHFMFYAGKAYQYKLDGEKNPIGEAVQDGYNQETSDRYAAKHSAYSYEDLPSDKFGADFAVNYFDPESDKTFGEQLLYYMSKVLKATAPENAPNYDKLPKKDTSNPPTRTNKTTTPVYTEDNP